MEFRITAGDPFSQSHLQPDLTLAVPHMAAKYARQLAKEKLEEVGLRLNMTKCMIYTPSQVVPPGMENWWEQTKRHDGLIIAGRSYSIVGESLETNLKAWERCFQ